MSVAVSTAPPPLLPPGERANLIARAAFWPIAVLLVLHRVFFLAANGSPTDDFTTVYSAVRRFLTGVPVYNENYATVDPHYLYNPGATLLLAPMGVSADLDASRAVFIVVNALAIVGALAITTRLIGHRLSSWVWPAAVAGAFLTESVVNTLVFSNINGVLLLVFTAFLWLFLHGRRWWAGLMLGAAIVVKPMFAPVLLLPVLRLDWRTLVGGVGVPVGANLIAWPLVPQASDYVTRVMPYLSQTRDYANASLAGLAVYFDMPAGLEWALWLALGACVAVAVAGLWFWRDRDPVFWALTTSGVLLTGVFVMSSLGQMYYSMMLFPMIMTVLRKVSVFHVWPAWVAAFLVLFPDGWHRDDFPVAGSWASLFGATAGWSLLLLVSAVAVAVWSAPLLREWRGNIGHSDSVVADESPDRDLTSTQRTVT